MSHRRCETCGKGFLRRERYVTHVRIHTGEKPFVCAVCARGYRDKRELRKHQASHNHAGQAAPIPGNPQAIAAVNAAQAAAQTQHAGASASAPTALAVTAPVTGPPSAASVAAAGGAAALPALPAGILSSGQASPGDTKTIVVQQTVSLPSQPLPKEVLNMNGNANQVQIIQQPAPLNPATIPLPPSVATALQSINEKVAARHAKQAKQAIQNLATQPAPPPPPQTITIAKQEAPQVVAIPQAAVAAASNSSNGSPIYYYMLPSNVPYSIASEGGATVRVTTEGGNVSTAQVVSVPASAIQGIQGNATTPVQVVAGGTPVIQTNGGTVVSTAGSTATTSFPASWIIETTSPTGTAATTRGGGSGANAM